MNLITNSVIPPVSTKRMEKPTAFKGLVVVPTDNMELVHKIADSVDCSYLIGKKIAGFFAKGVAEQKILELAGLAKEVAAQPGKAIKSALADYLPSIKTLQDFIDFNPKDYTK